MPILQKPHLAEETLLFPYAVSTRSASITLDFLSPVLHGSRAVSSRSRGGFANLLHAQEGRCRAPFIVSQISVLAGIRATQQYGAPIPRDPSASPDRFPAVHDPSILSWNAKAHHQMNAYGGERAITQTTGSQAGSKKVGGVHVGLAVRMKGG